ncbi:MAG TPA: flippase-like domain-containing protein [Candidatus Limnocylindrales bacterium]|nr:flippase-like domain-containing protein [Candidatus Limnocylindrales bacterium]
MNDAGVSAASPSVAAAPAIRRARPAPRQVVLPLVILGVVFVVVLPRIVDYRAVLAALAALDAGDVALLAATSCLAYVASAVPYRVLVRELSWRHAVGADLAGRAVASTIPGPTDIATRLVLYSQWGIPLNRASAGLVIGGLLETVSALVLPLIAVIVIVLGGGTTEPAGAMLAAIGVLLLAVGTAAFTTIVRSKRLARRIGDWLAGAIGWVARKLRRPGPSGVSDAVMDLREQLHEILNRDGLAAYGAAVLAKLAWFLVLEMSLRACGVGPDVISPPTVLATMAIVSFVALLPVTPGALGVSEVAYIGLLTAAIDPAHAAQVAAAVLLYRVAQWLVPIPLGWALLIVMRRGHGLFADA